MGQVGAALAALLLAGCATQELPGVRSGERLMVIGLGGLDPGRVQLLMEQGRLPHLASLKARGGQARVAAVPPPLPPLLWSTLATGRLPDAHGVLEFVPSPTDSSAAGTAGTLPQVKTLWEVAGDAGLTTATVGWWSTWPARSGDGFLVTDRWVGGAAHTPRTTPSAQGAVGLVAPPELLSRLRQALVEPEMLGPAELGRFLPLSAADRGLLAAGSGAEEDPLQPVLGLRRVVAATRSVEAAALLLMAEEAPDLIMVGFAGVDAVQHLFARYEDPALPGVTAGEERRYGGVVESFYRYQDEVVGRLVAAAGAEAVTVVVSTHGFARGARRPPADPVTATGRAMLWHDGPGILLLAGKPFSAADLGMVALADIMPTLLVTLGLPVAEDLAGSPLRGALTRSFLTAYPITTISSYERLGRRPRQSATGEVSAPLSADGQVNLATVLAHQGRTVEAREAYAAALAADPGFLPAHMGLFELLDGVGLEAEAMAAGQQCLAAAVAPPTEIYPRLARLWVAADEVEAGRDFLEAHPGAPGEPGVWLARSILAAGSGDDDAALDALQRALERDPGSWDVARALVEFHEQRDQLQMAIPALRRGLAARGGDSLPHLVALGYCALAAGDLAAAGDYLSRAVEIAPYQEEALYYLGSVHFRSGRYSDAVGLWSRLVEVAPAHDDGRANLILALARTGRIARALEVYRAAGPDSRERPRLLNAAAAACLLNGLAEEGLLLARRALDLAPQDEEARRLVAALEAESAAAPAEMP